MSDARCCDACGVVTTETPRNDPWARVGLPNPHVDFSKPADRWGSPIDMIRVPFDVCSPGCLRTMADRWESDVQCGTGQGETK